MRGKINKTKLYLKRLPNDSPWQYLKKTRERGKEGERKDTNNVRSEKMNKILVLTKI